MLILSGAATTSLLRAPLSNPAIGPATFTTHRLGGIAVAVLLVIFLLRDRRPRRMAAAFVTATAITGLVAGRSLAPSTVAFHAWLALLTAVMLAVASSPRATGPSTDVRVRWTAIVARLGLILMLLQAAIGAMLRHQLTSLGWHVLVAGLASIAVLVPAVSTLQMASQDKRTLACAVFAIAATVTQVILGTGVLVMMLSANPSVALWVSTTVAHVVAGTLTLVATAMFAAALRS